MVHALNSPCCKQEMNLITHVVWTDEVSPDDSSEVKEGILGCTACNREFPIIDGIPRLCLDLFPFEKDILNRSKVKPLQAQIAKPQIKDVYLKIEELVREKIKSDSKSHYSRKRYDAQLAFRVKECEYQEKYVKTLNAFHDRRISTLLDIGGGQGGLIYCCNRMLKPTTSVLLDYDLSWVEVAKIRNPSIEVVRADAANIPFKSHYFDLTISQATLEHIPDYKKAITEMCRVTKQTLFLCWNPNKYSLYDFGHVDAPVTIFPKSVAKYLAFAWHKIRRTGRSMDWIEEELKKTFYISTSTVEKIMRRYGKTHNVFSNFVINSLEDGEKGRFVSQKKLLSKYKFLSRFFLDALAFCRIEPQCYYVLKKSIPEAPEVISKKY